MPSSARYTIPPPLGKLGAGHRVPAPNAAWLICRPSGRSQEITSGTVVPRGRPEFGGEVVVRLLWLMNMVLNLYSVVPRLCIGRDAAPV
jgi:hypothetical protein